MHDILSSCWLPGFAVGDESVDNEAAGSPPGAVLEGTVVITKEEYA
jgi:hypothetical protein